MRTQVVQEFGADPGMVQRIRRPSSPNRRHFGRGACSTRCSGVRPNRMLARDALMLLLATVPATATATENDSQSANSIMPGCNAWLAQLSRGSTALGSNVFLAGECMGIIGTILYFSRDFSFSSAACPPANVTYNQAIQIVTAYISARPQRIQERFIDLATEALHDA